MSLFFVDSSSELDAILCKKMGIEKIDLPYIINNEKKSFDSEFDFGKFYSKIKKGVCIEKYNLSTEEYMQIFEPCLAQGDDISYVHSSQYLTNTENFLLARDMLLEKYPERQFALIDSNSFSIGQGLVSYDCAMLYRKGDSVAEIYDKSFDIKKEYAMYFAVNTIENMANHNLIESNSVSGTSLNIKPIFAMDIDGKIQLVDKVSGKKKVVLKLLELCRQLGSNVADYPIGISYSGENTLALELKDKIYETFGKDVNLIVEPMSPANTAMLGNNALAISFHTLCKMH